MFRMVTSATASQIRPATAADKGSIRLAAIDVGSNSIHMIIAQADADGGVTTLWRMKEHVGLGRLSFPSHRLSTEATDAAITTLARMTARYVKSDPISKDDLRALRRHYESELAPVMEQIRNQNPVSAIGTSGTLENIAAMCGDPHQIERQAFDKLIGELIDSDTKARAKIKGLDDQRKDQIVAGAVLVGEVFERLNLKQITLCPAALREGILLDYLHRHTPELEIRRDVPDPRRRGVLDLARKYDWHQKHSEQVTHLCLELFDHLKSLHGMGQEERELIEYASLLHDIGWHISGKSHHKHSLYLITHGGLKDFNSQEIEIIANIARYHRKGPPRKKQQLYAQLSGRSRRVV